MAANISAEQVIEPTAITMDIDGLSPDEALSIFDRANNGDQECLEAMKNLSENDLFRFYLKAFVPFVERSNRLHALQPNIDRPH
ncbi:MAG: hypothetical protein P8Y45_00145 [Exilibacterium sp.]